MDGAHVPVQPAMVMYLEEANCWAAMSGLAEQGEAKAIRGARGLALPCLASHHSLWTDEMGSEANMLSPSNTHIQIQ